MTDLAKQTGIAVAAAGVQERERPAQYGRDM